MIAETVTDWLDPTWLIGADGGALAIGPGGHDEPSSGAEVGVGVERRRGLACARTLVEQMRDRGSAG
jgi:hypothetical protein